MLRKYHPDNENGSTEITQQINAEYDILFVILSKETQSDNQSPIYDKDDENKVFKEVLNSIIHINADIEIIRDIAVEIQYEPETWCDDAEGKRLRYETYAKRFMERFKKAE